MKVAIYSRGKKLAVREQPKPDAPLVGTLGSGTAVVVEEAAEGWLECCMGYIREDLVTVGELYGSARLAEEPEQPEAQPEADDNAGLMAMKINELRELAKGSGVALPKNATKAQIIELLMGSDEQA